MHRALLFIIGILGLMNTVHGADFPFTDVKQTDPYFSAVKELFDGGVITNNGDNLFRPGELMNRDFYISLTVGVGCKKCTTPSQDDIIRYQISPFPDLPKINQYYYCIAYASDENIAQGYTLDTTGKALCENGSSYASVPFCPANTITRIEAAAVLLRRANLWNDDLNTTAFDRTTLTISDTSTYWYGYAKKGIEIGIVSKKTDGTIGQDEKITRGEFAIMAAKILRYTQCELDTNLDNTVIGEIAIHDKNDQIIGKSSFKKGDDFTLVPITSPGNWNYSWYAINPSTGEIIVGSGDSLAGDLFGVGRWIVSLDIIDPITGDTVSHPTLTLQVSDTLSGVNSGSGGGDGLIYNGDIIIRDKDNTIRNDSRFSLDDSINLFNAQTGVTGDSSWKAVEKSTGRIVIGDQSTLAGSLLGIGEWDITLNTLDPKTKTIQDTDIRKIFISDGNNVSSNTGITNPGDLSVLIGATPLISYIGGTINLTAEVSGGSSLNTYNWDFGDGNTSTVPGDTSHIYTTPGIYTIRLTVTDEVTGITSQSSVIIEVTGEEDTDNDRIFDSVDNCPMVFGSRDNNGCPSLTTTDYTSLITDILGGRDDTTDTDGDGTNDVFDACPFIRGTVANKGCPTGGTGDTDGDAVIDGVDKCVNIPGLPSNRGCPEISLTDDIKKNACIKEKLQSEGVIFGSVACSTCPCTRSLNLLAVLRSCDIVFPTILSPDGQNVYSRGGFYTIR